MASKSKLIELAKNQFEKDEETISVVVGAFQRSVDGKNTLRSGVIIATNKKLRFSGKRFFKVYSDIIEYNSISRVEAIEENLGYRILISGKKDSSVIKFGECDDINKFVKYINEQKKRKK